MSHNALKMSIAMTTLVCFIFCDQPGGSGVCNYPVATLVAYPSNVCRHLCVLFVIAIPEMYTGAMPNNWPRDTAEGAAKWAWNRISARAGGKYISRVRTTTNPYTHVRLLMTRAEFLEWAIPAYRHWFATQKGIRPSIDRIDSHGHYQLSNIRLIPLDENRRAASWYKNKNAPLGTAWCTGCKDYLPFESFTIDRQKKLGVHSRCKPCLAEYRKQRSLL